ncbi:hypothetical protein [Algibacter pacificus]|uniref:hypothetical protein n=1 Tax=Algibacter pacificus TaxID=2599389 RepID=UPI0011CB8DF8|nr:hypothetical protein [Algibacter pacificus]
MSFNITYKPLCTLNFYHHYFLDDGVTPFDDANAPNLKQEQLEKYNIQDFARIQPTEQTKKILANQKIIFKQNNTGFSLLIQAEETNIADTYKPFIALTQNENLQFLIYITDSIFENYSTVPAVPLTPYYFSNKQPSTEIANWNGINTESDIPHTAIENYSISTATNTLLSNSIHSKERQQLFGIISLSVAADNSTKSLLEPSGNLPLSPPDFKIQLANRKTFWHYLNAKDGSVIHKSPTTLPLVKNGIIAYTFNTTARRPVATPNSLVFEKDGSGTIIKTISEIFI